MPTLFWFLAYVHVHSLQDKFRTEIMRFSKPTSSSGSSILQYDYAGLLSSELLQSALKETLQIHAHNLSPRNLQEDTIVKVEGRSYLLKKGDVAFAPSTLVNWNPQIYTDPTK
jgi:cytochrome P450